MLKRAILSYSFCLMACVSAQAQTAVCFDTSIYASFTTSYHPSLITNADFNLDGNIDLAVSKSATDTINILLGNGVGGFALPLSFSVNTGLVTLNHAISTGLIYGLISADFNKDGKPDIATLNHGTNNVSVMLGNGIGGFATTNNFKVGQNPYSIINADFNKDGNPDLAVTNFGTGSGNTISVLIGDGTGNFAPSSNYTVGANPYGLTSADFNGDGNPDLAVTNNNSFVPPVGIWGISTISILMGNGTGSFGTIFTDTVAWTPQIITNADFNNDGNADLVFAATSQTTGKPCTYIMLGNGTGSFASEVSILNYSGIITCADFNGDGNIDLAITGGGINSNKGKVSVLLGNGDGSFAPAQNFAVGFTALFTTCGDFNKDGKPDLATANSNQNANTVSILLNCTEFPPQKKNDNQVIIPNIFTPNGDNINDTFLIKGANLSNFSCKIYDRWGLLLYLWTDINSGWNGKDKNGTASTDGTYFYVITYTDSIGKSQTQKGFLQLLR